MTAFRNVDRTQFLGPDTADCLQPILQFSARIGELRADGYHIEAHGRRNRCVVYRLIADPPAQQPAPADPSLSEPARSAAPLFEAAPLVPRCTVLGDDR